MKNLKWGLTVSGLLFLSNFATPGKTYAVATADYYRCVNKESGEWNYGRAPMVCSASSFGDDSVVTQSYSSVIFKDTAVRDTERRRYLQELHSLVREAATVYLKKRKPTVTATELAAWVRGVVATSAHESYWSHYRQTTDGRLKMMRGDSGHGHGLMQIDDRAHFPAVEQGIAWNLISHVTYAMDIFYSAWEKAPAQSCVKNATDPWQARIRSAWAAYNGGPAKLCRWTDPNNAWAANDKNFYSILTGEKWVASIADLNRKTDVPVACLMEKRENCALTTPGADTDTLQEAQTYAIGKKICLAKNSILFCVDDSRDRVCLEAIGPVNGKPTIEWSPIQAARYAQNMQDRHELCSLAEKSLSAVGTAVRIQKNINLRATPGGGLLGTVPAGSVLQVRDFELRSNGADRYYKVLFGKVEGFIFGGNDLDYPRWASSIASSFSASSSMARLSDSVRIANTAGINFRLTPGGTLIKNIPKGTVLKVLEVLPRSSDNGIYYRVSYLGKMGYIYSGTLLPSDGLAAWTRVVEP